MSKQHVIPKRLRRVLLPTGSVRQAERWQNVRFEGHDVGFTETNKTQTGSTAASKVRRVCKPCNEGWLNEMEQECVPILEQLIRGEIWLLFPENQIKLARIATSMAMIAPQLHGQDITPQAERRRFLETLAPPPGYYIFLGRSALNHRDPVITGDAAKASEPDVPGEKLYEISTIVVGPVLLHVLSVSPELVWDVDDYARKLGLAPIWPTRDCIYVTRMPRLTDSDLERIRAFVRIVFRKANAT